MHRIFIALCALFGACAILSTAEPALASGSAPLTGTVYAGDDPVAAAPVTALGDGITAKTRTDERGRFAFTSLSPGSYIVSTRTTQGTASVSVDLPASGLDIDINVRPKALARVGVTASALIKKSGTDVTLNSTALSRSPAQGSFSALLIQLPGAARGANGVVHINGDHGDINYIVDGISIPQELNRDIGHEFNPDDVSFMDVIEGAYPAQYGERFASVLNIATRNSVGAERITGDLDAGSFGTLDGTVGFESPLGRGSFVTSFRDNMTNRGLDPPDPDSPHNAASDANEFVRYTLPHGNDFLNLTVSHALQTYELPVDVLGGAPPSTDDNESQDDLFAAVTARHALDDRGSVTYGFGYKNSRILDFGDPANDWTYGEALNLAAGGSPMDCANARTISNFTAGTCGYSLAARRDATDYKFNLDDSIASGPHQIGWGVLYDAAQVSKDFSVTLQPGNFLAPIYSPATPGAPYTVTDDAPNDGHTEAAYVEDGWRMGSRFELDYGLRGDAFQLRSSQFARGFSQVSPRVKFTRTFGDRSSVYVYYGRFFTPFSFENVSPRAAQLLNLPLQRQVAAFDLKPQRDSDYEIGGHLPAAGGDLGLRVMQKDATDLIDDTQVGVTLLHQVINYQLGRIATQTLSYQLATARQGRFYVTLNHTYSVNKGCETQLLAPCFGSPADWTPADHEQRWGSTVGDQIDDGRGGWFSIDGEYGSGLSSAACLAGTPGFCKYTPHTTFDIEKAFQMSPSTRLRFRIRNLLDDQYRITYLNAQGNHWYAGRAFDVDWQFGDRP
jgi:hypothetical protein